MNSRTPSPAKSPRRQALTSKDANIRQSPLLKPLTTNSTPRLSPQHISKPSSKSPSISPKKLNGSATGDLLHKPAPQLGFKIFEDPTDYSTGLLLSSTLLIHDENDLAGQKENVAPHSPTNTRLQHSKRVVLGELDILETPGFVTYHNSRDAVTSGHPRGMRAGAQQTYQLDTLWNLDGTRRIPSFVTPPRNDRVKYISFTQDKVTKMKRSNSGSDLKDKVVKKLVFGIHKDL